MATSLPAGRSLLPAMVALSVALHGVAWGLGARALPAARSPRPIEVEVVRRAPPPRAAPTPSPPPAPPPAPRPAPRRVAVAAPPPASMTPAPPAPAEAPRPLPRVGISLGSTVDAGSFAVGVGNTTLGRAEEAAADPASIRPLPGGPPSVGASTPPRPQALPRIPYPPESRRAGVEGQVLLLLRIDARGAVTAVRVLDAPAPDLAAAAAEGARRFRFDPALRDGRPVEAEIRFTYTFLLE